MPIRSSAQPSAAAKAANAAVNVSDPSVFLLTGVETGSKNAEIARLITKYVTPDFADFDSEVLDGSTADADRVLSAVNLAPFGSTKRVVVVRDSQQLSQEDQKRIAASLAKISANSLLVLHTGAPVVEDGKTKRQSVVCLELSNAVKKLGKVIEFGLPRGEDIRAWVQQEASLTGKTLTSEALSLLSQLTGEDVRRIRTELAKAASHAGDSDVIRGADVEATISRGSDDVIFKLCDAVGARRAAEALGHVSSLFRGTSARPDAVAARTLVLIARQIRLLAQFQYLVEKKMAGRGAGPASEETLTYLPVDGAGGMVNNPRTRWMADKYAVQARNFSAAELASRLELVLATDLALKGIKPGGDSPQALMQRLIVGLC